jgi:hypothetical protein
VQPSTATGSAPVVYRRRFRSSRPSAATVPPRAPSGASSARNRRPASSRTVDRPASP